MNDKPTPRRRANGIAEARRRFGAPTPESSGGRAPEPPDWSSASARVRAQLRRRFGDPNALDTDDTPGGDAA